MDWSISAGIFIIYILALFILVAPAFKQYTTQEYLGSIVKDGVKENLSLELERFPVFVKTTEEITSDQFQFTLINLPNDFDQETTDYKFTIINNLGNEVIEKNYNAQTNEISFDSSFTNIGIINPQVDVGKIYIYLSKDKEIFSSSIPTNPIWGGILSNTFGISETIPGIYQQNLDDLQIRGYEVTKTNFNYPENRDFIITIYGGTDLANPPIFTYPSDLEPQEKDTVNTLVWSDWMIDGTLIRTPITIVVRTW